MCPFFLLPTCQPQKVFPPFNRQTNFIVYEHTSNYAHFFWTVFLYSVPGKKSSEVCVMKEFSENMYWKQLSPIRQSASWRTPAPLMRPLAAAACCWCCKKTERSILAQANSSLATYLRATEELLAFDGWWLRSPVHDNQLSTWKEWVPDSISTAWVMLFREEPVEGLQTTAWSEGPRGYSWLFLCIRAIIGFNLKGASACQGFEKNEPSPISVISVIPLMPVWNLPIWNHSWEI